MCTPRLYTFVNETHLFNFFMDNLKYVSLSKDFECFGLRSSDCKKLYIQVVSNWKEERECFNEMKVFM